MYCILMNVLYYILMNVLYFLMNVLLMKMDCSFCFMIDVNLYNLLLDYYVCLLLLIE